MSDDPAARFGAFVRSEERAMLALAGALCGDRREAGDIVADVVSRIWERREQVFAAQRPGAYARRMVVNEFLTRRRRHRRVVLTPRLEEHALVVGDHAGEHAERETLRARLAELPARQRAAITLRYYEDLSDRQIADLLGCAPGTVRSLISRALAGLRVQPAPRDDTTAHEAPPRRGPTRTEEPA